MVDFPASLPKPYVGTLEVGGIDPWVSDPAEVGTGRRRKRFTRDLATFSFLLQLTTDQLATLNAFYDATLGGGVESFTWISLHNGQAYTVRFSERYPTRQVTHGHWDVSISLTEI